MATKEELSDQLALTQKLSSVVDQMARSMAKVESSFETQIQAIEKLTKAMESLKNTDLSQLNSTRLDKLRGEMLASEKSVNSLNTRMMNFGTWLQKKFPSSAGAAAGALSGFAQGIKNMLALGKGVTGFFSGLVDWVGSFVGSIISIPFQIFDRLVNAAAGAGGGVNELAQAIENLRKEIGDLAGPGSKAVLDTTKTMKGFADTGLNVFQVFGTLAERLEFVTKTAVAMGATFGILRKEFEDNGGALLAFQKGLGISEEQMKAIGDRAITMGKPITKVFMDMTKQTLALGKAFELDQKLIGKDMAKALQDVKHFGALTVKEIGQASVYARKLGVELDKIVGTLDAFETFDSAAESAAKLSQSFGVQVDAFKLMEAQNPAEQVDMLRKSFREAGVDASTFTRQQARLLAMTTGLDEATAKQVFSSKNYGSSLDDIKKKSEAAEKKTMTQAEAMSQLAASIERMVKAGQAQEGGFWKMFLKGISTGIQSTEEFRKIIINIKMALNAVYIEGIRLGKAIVDLFPGLKDLMKGMGDFFDPAKFKSLAHGVTDVIIQFMKDLSDPNGKASFSSLMDRLREKFFDFFDKENPAGKKMLEGFKTVFKTVTKIIGEGVKWIVDKIGEALKWVADVIRDPRKMLAGATSAASGGLGFLAEVLGPLAEALKHAWVVIAPAMWDLVKTVGKKLYEYLTSDQFVSMVKPVVPYLASVFFGPAFGRAILGALTASIGKAALGLLTGGGKKAIEALGEKASSVISASNKVSSKVGDTKGIEQVGAINKATGEATAGGKDWGVKDAVRLGAKLVAIAAALSIGGVLVATSIVAMRKILDAGGIKSLKDVEAPLLILGSMVLMSIPLMLSMKLAGQFKPTDILKGGIVIAAAVGIVGATGALLAYVLKQVGTPEQLAAAGNLMLKMSLVFLAMVPLILASMVIGALATGPQAIALGLAAVGMGVLGAAVAEMATIAVGIVKELSAMRIDADFQRKIDAFLGVMKSIQAFADTLVKVIGLMEPSFTELISGTASSFSDKVDAAVKLIGEMVGQKGGGKGIIGVVEVVMDSIRSLNVSKGMAEAAKVFSDVMHGITEFMKAAQPPDAFYEAGSSFLNRLTDPGYNFQNLVHDIGNYAKIMRDGAMEMLTGTANGTGDGGILGIISKIGKLSAQMPSPENVQAVSGLIASTASILQTLTPSPETMKAFSNVAEESVLWGAFKEKVTVVNTNAIKTTIQTMGEQMQELLPVLMSSVIEKVVEQASGLSKDKLENIKALGGVVAAISGIASAMVGIAKGKKVTPVEIAGATQFAIEEAPDLKTLFEGIGASLPGLVDAVIKTVSNIKVDANFDRLAKNAEQLFGFIKTLTDVAGTLSGAGTGEMINPNTMVESFQKLAYFMYAIMEGGGGWGRGMHNASEDSPLRLIISDLKKLSGMGLDDAKGSALKAAEGLAGLFKAVSEIVSSIAKASAGDISNVSLNAFMLFDGIDKLISGILTDARGGPGILSKVKNALDASAMSDIASTGSSLKAFGDQMKKVSDAIKVDGITQALTAVSDMVKQTQALDDALSALPKIDVNTKLERVAKSVGLGSKAVYTVKSKDVIINLNLQVTMDVGEVEKIVVLRKSSIIRDRINLALDTNEAAKLPENVNSPVAIPGPAKTG